MNTYVEKRLGLSLCAVIAAFSITLMAPLTARAATTPFESYCVPPAPNVVQPDAVRWLDNGLSIFTIGNNTTGLGYQESGFQDVVTQLGGTLTTLNGNTDYSFTGNTGPGSAVNSVGTFSNGTLRFSTTYTTTNRSEFRTTTAANFFSGNTGNGVYIFPEQGGNAGDAYTVSIDFTTAVNAFSFDLIDIFDTIPTNTPVVRYEVYADNTLVAYLRGAFFGDDLTSTLTMHDASGAVRGTMLAGQNIENTFGFIASEPVSNVSIRHIVESGVIEANARDPHGLDMLTFSTDIVCVKPADYGDAPTSGTAPNGISSNAYGDASHSIDNAIYLGASAPDEDTASQGVAGASGDDNDGTDDEDGIIIPELTRGGRTSIVADVAGSGGYLQAWIDWNGDGDFNDSGSRLLKIFRTMARATSTQTPGRLPLM